MEKSIINFEGKDQKDMTDNVGPYQLQIFRKDDVKVRTCFFNDEVWFVGKDVCDYFNDKNYLRSLSRLDDVDKLKMPFDTPGGKQQMIVINEPGLYSLLFSMHPQKARKENGKYVSPSVQKRVEKLESFKRWVTHEVLPSIRKTGGYKLPGTFADALRLAADQHDKLQLQSKLIEQQKKRIELDKPKIEFYKAVTGSRETISIGESAKVLNMGIGQNNLFKILREKKILMKNNQPYQEFIDRGYFRTIEQKYTVREETRISIKTVVYQKGLAFIRKTIENYNESKLLSNVS
jgi:prophage antirepressor-like protein